MTLDERFRDFDAERAERREATLRFRLGGEDFTCDSDIPATAVFDLAVLSSLSGIEVFKAFRDFLGDVVPDDERLMRVLREKRIGLRTLKEVVMWIVSESTARPTKRRSASPESPRPTGRQSRVVSLSPDTRTASAG